MQSDSKGEITVFKTNYKATLKSILRSPIILIALGATLIVAYASHNGASHTAEGYVTQLYKLRQQIANHSISTCLSVFPAFVGMLVSAYVLSDLRNGFGDLLVSSRKSIFSIYLSKICAIGTVAFAARLLVLAAGVVWFWTVHYPVEFIPDGAVLPLGKVLAGYAASEAAFVPFMLLCYIAMPTFVCAITNIPASGAVWNICHYLIKIVYTPLQYTNFCLVPFSVWRYYTSFYFIEDPQMMEDMQAGLIVDGLGMTSTTLPEALTAYVGWIVFSVALLTAAYFILKRRYRT